MAAKRKHPPRVEFWRLKKPGQLTPEEFECVRIALEFMVARVGSSQDLAYRMGVDRTFVRRALKERPRPGVVMAFEIARVAGTTVEAIVSGAFPPPDACPKCWVAPPKDGG